MKKSKLSSPALLLFFLSPMIGELLSGSAAPMEFFNPVGFVMLAILYGGGAILVRKPTHHWGKGWPTLLVLGAAHGIAEEGLMCKSFFDANLMDLGPEPLTLSDEKSLWAAGVYIAAAKKVPGAEIVRISGTFLTGFFVARTTRLYWRRFRNPICRHDPQVHDALLRQILRSCQRYTKLSTSF